MPRLLPIIMLAGSLGATAYASTMTQAKEPIGVGFARAMARGLPTRAGVTLVHLHCSAAKGQKCRGRVRLLPHDERTRRLTGSGALASRSFASSARRITLRLRLTPRARNALKRHSLAVRAELSSGGHRSSRAVVIVEADSVRAHSKPDHVKIEHPPRGDGAGTVKTYSWSWDIPAHNYLDLPAFQCPDDAPYVQTDGQAVSAYRSGDPVTGYEAKLEVSASEGTGYGAFDHSTRQSYNPNPRPRGAYKDSTYNAMTGWVEGTWAYNSIWAPVFSKGHFELTVTCTDAKSQAAYAQDGYAMGFFPWSSFTRVKG